jgi:hypothetical protein
MAALKTITRNDRQKNAPRFRVRTLDLLAFVLHGSKGTSHLAIIEFDLISNLDKRDRNRSAHHPFKSIRARIVHKKIRGKGGVVFWARGLVEANQGLGSAAASRISHFATHQG